MFSVIYHPRAERELIKAARLYNKKVPGLGADLLEEVDRAVAAILQEPTRWRMFEKDFRRYVVKRFRYSIIYRIRGDEIRVLAVAHHSRDPDFWKHRAQK